MEEYLDKLENNIKDKNLRQFCIFPDLKTFKIIKKNGTEIKKFLKENPHKYAGRHVAVITLTTTKSGFKRNKDIFSIGITIYIVEEDGTIDQIPRNVWGLLLLYTAEELEKHPFNMKNLEKIIKIVDKKQVVGGLFGITYTEFKKKIEAYKKKSNNRTIKSKRSIKSKKTSKKSKK